jgi:hypothetical protein
MVLAASMSRQQVSIIGTMCGDNGAMNLCHRELFLQVLKPYQSNYSSVGSGLRCKGSFDLLDEQIVRDTEAKIWADIETWRTYCGWDMCSTV